MRRALIVIGIVCLMGMSFVGGMLLGRNTPPPPPMRTRRDRALLEHRRMFIESIAPLREERVRSFLRWREEFIKPNPDTQFLRREGLKIVHLRAEMDSLLIEHLISLVPITKVEERRRIVRSLKHFCPGQFPRSDKRRGRNEGR